MRSLVSAPRSTGAWEALESILTDQGELAPIDDCVARIVTVEAGGHKPVDIVILVSESDVCRLDTRYGGAVGGRVRGLSEESASFDLIDDSRRLMVLPGTSTKYVESVIRKAIERHITEKGADDATANKVLQDAFSGRIGRVRASDHEPIVTSSRVIRKGEELEKLRPRLPKGWRHVVVNSARKPRSYPVAEIDVEKACDTPYRRRNFFRNWRCVVAGVGLCGGILTYLGWRLYSSFYGGEPNHPGVFSALVMNNSTEDIISPALETWSAVNQTLLYPVDNSSDIRHPSVEGLIQTAMTNYLALTQAEVDVVRKYGYEAVADMLGSVAGSSTACGSRHYPYGDYCDGPASVLMCHNQGRGNGRGPCYYYGGPFKLTGHEIVNLIRVTDRSTTCSSHCLTDEQFRRDYFPSIRRFKRGRKDARPAFRRGVYVATPEFLQDFTAVVERGFKKYIRDDRCSGVCHGLGCVDGRFGGCMCTYSKVACLMILGEHGEHYHDGEVGWKTTMQHTLNRVAKFGDPFECVFECANFI